MRVLHIITDLDNGGAESILYKLIKLTPDIKHEVICLTSNGIYVKLIEELGVSVLCCNFKKNILDFFKLFKLFKYIYTSKSNIVQTWMYHSDFLGGILAKLSYKKNIIWGIHGPFNKQNTNIVTKFIVYANALLSYIIPNKIVIVSSHALINHKKVGYNSKKFVLINNGYSSEEFYYNEQGKSLISNKYNIDSNRIILGMVARFDPYKDHDNLFKALLLLQSSNIKFTCLLIGSKMVSENLQLSNLINLYGLSNNIILVGPKFKISKYISALDIHILSSLDESFPNVLSEAMLCNIPCISTDVGDAKLIIGDTGWVVSKREPDKLYHAILEAINMINFDKLNWNLKRKHCRERIIQNFSIQFMIEKYINIWKNY